MALETLQDIIRALQAHPEWREPLLEALLPQRFQQLPEHTDRLEEALTRLAEQSAETDRRLRELSEETNKRFQEMAEQRSASDRRIEQLTARVDDLTVKLEQLTARVDELAVRMDRLVERFDIMQRDLGELKGFHLEQYYRTNATAILGLFFRRLRVVDKGRLIDSLYEQKPLRREEWEQISAIDLLVTGRQRPTDEEQMLVWEISWTVDESDVLRALERAELLRQRGMNALPVVAGKGITGNALELAKNRKVIAILGASPIDGTGIEG